jgi:hypothetical protein
MKLDAAALAEVECKYEYLSLMSADSVSDIQLKNKSKDAKDIKDEMSVNFFHKYYKEKEVREEFKDMVRSFNGELTVCKKLEEYKILQQTINGNDSIPQKNKKKSKK